LTRTVIPGADRGGLFADGVVNLALVDTSTWKTYANAQYGYSFMYPPTWELIETDSGGRTGPQGQPSYPRQSALVRNPAAEQGANVRGQNCVDAGCIEAPPFFLAFQASITRGACNVAGDLLAEDVLTINGRVSQRCVVRSAFDQSTREVAIAFPIASGEHLKLILARGRQVTSAQQAVLETVLSTFTLAR
jgi:hypothetical protein